MTSVVNSIEYHFIEISCGTWSSSFHSRNTLLQSVKIFSNICSNGEDSQSKASIIREVGIFTQSKCCDLKLGYFHLYFVLQELLQNTSPAISSSYGSVKLVTTTSSSGTATSFASSLRTEGPAMLVDPLYRLAHYFLFAWPSRCSMRFN